jgi:hypothetical protein
MKRNQSFRNSTNEVLENTRPGIEDNWSYITRDNPKASFYNTFDKLVLEKVALMVDR